MTPEQRLQERREQQRLRKRAERAADPEAHRRKQREYGRRSRELDPDTHKDRMLRWKYGITLEQFEARLEAQKHRCAICKTADWGGKHDTPNVDHDHTTGEIRGMLCHGCNAGLGSFGDRPEVMRAAADYIEGSPLAPRGLQ